MTSLDALKEIDDFTAPIEEAIEYETVVFKISGGGTRQDPVTPYEGPPTLEKDMRWYELMNGKPPSHDAIEQKSKD